MPSPITATCPSCQKRLRAKQELLGRRVRCPNCSQPFTVHPPAVAGSRPAQPMPGPTPSRHAASEPRSTGPALARSVAPRKSRTSPPTTSTRKLWIKGTIIGLVTLTTILLAVGGYFGLQAILNSSTDPSGDIVFADFEDGTYNGWRQEGDAFGKTPKSSFATANRDDIFACHPWPANGEFVADSLFAANRPLGPTVTGKLTSPSFQIQHGFINFMAAGKIEGVRLLIDGETVRVGTRSDDLHFDQIAPIAIDVGQFIGKTAYIEIIDDGVSQRDYVCADRFVFSNMDLRDQWNQELVEQAKQQVVEVLGRKYYFGPIPLSISNTENLAKTLDGQVLTIESDEEAQSLVPHLNGHSWLGIRKIDGVWQNQKGDVYTHIDWGHDMQGLPGRGEKYANVTTEGELQHVSYGLRYPVIEFGQPQQLPAYQLTAPDANRRLAEYLIESKAPFILATADRFLYQWHKVDRNYDTPLPDEPFEVQHISLPGGFRVDSEVEDLFHFDNRIRHLWIKDGNDDSLTIVRHLKHLRSFSVIEGSYASWKGLSFMPPEHPLKRLELNKVKFTAQQVAPLFRAKGLRSINFFVVKLSPEMGELIASQGDSLVSYSSNVCSGLGREGFKLFGKLRCLRNAMLWGSGVHDDDLPHLGQISTLESVQLGENRGITGTTLDQLAAWQNLSSLSLWGNPIDDLGLAKLPVLSSLRTLSLGRTKITGDSVKRLSQLPGLEHLDINKTGVDDASIPALLNCQNLKRLEAADTNVTDAGLSDFFEQIPGFTANLEGK